MFTRNFVNVATVVEELFSFLISFGKLLIHVLGAGASGLGQAFPYL